MIKIKNKLFNYDLVISLDYATNDEGKAWLLVILKTDKDNKVWIPVLDEKEYQSIILDVINQVKNK